MWGSIFRVLIRLLGAGGRATGTVAQRAVPLSRAGGGRVVIGGLIRNRPLGQLTQDQVRKALAQAGLREAHNGHFVSRLIARGPSVGINTLDDFARALNSGVATAGRDGTVLVRLGRGGVVVFNRAGHLVTLTF